MSYPKSRTPTHPNPYPTGVIVEWDGRYWQPISTCFCGHSEDAHGTTRKCCVHKCKCKRYRPALVKNQPMRKVKRIDNIKYALFDRPTPVMVTLSCGHFISAKLGAEENPKRMRCSECAKAKP